jgi:hypothetical protein
MQELTVQGDSPQLGAAVTLTSKPRRAVSKRLRARPVHRCGVTFRSVLGGAVEPGKHRKNRPLRQSARGRKASHPILLAVPGRLVPKRN